MAWNAIPLKDDDKVDFQVHYVRLNPLRQFLSPLAAELFESSWLDENAAMPGFRRGYLAGELVCDIVRTYQIDDAAAHEPAIGEWFTFSGATRYRDTSDGQRATIKLPTGLKLTGAVRVDCRLSASAETLMSGTDDTSTIVGRRTAADKFDLIAAGYRDPMVHWRSGDQEPSDFTERLRQHPLERPWRSAYPGSILHRFNFPDAPEELLPRVVMDATDQFGRIIEKEGGWRSLYNADGTVAHETRHQQIFQIASRLLFSAVGIHVDPHANHGVGATDLTLTLHSARHIIEFKKDTSTKTIEHGYSVQLPRYLNSAAAPRGTYIILCHAASTESALAAATWSNP